MANTQTRKQLIEGITSNLNAFKNKMHSKIAREGFKEALPHSQWMVLCIIEGNKDLGIKELSGMLGITSSAATQLVDALVVAGHVVRTTNTNDRRSLDLSLSKKGRAKVLHIRAKYATIMENLFKVLTDEELATLSALQKKILTNI